MGTIRFELSGGLSEARLLAVREQAIRVLGEVGLKVAHRETQEMLAAVEGVSIQGDRVRFSPDLCEKYLTLFRQEELAARSQEGYRMEGP